MNPPSHSTRMVAGCLLAVAMLLVGCTERYRDLAYSIDLEYDERDFLSLITIETGTRTKPGFMDRFSHGGPHFTKTDQRYELLVARWSTRDGRLLAIEPVAHERWWHDQPLAAGGDDLLLFSRRLFQRQEGTWQQVNAEREFNYWSDFPDIRGCFTPDHRRHLGGEGLELQVRDTLSGGIVTRRAMNEAWHRFAQRATFNLAEWTLDSTGRRVFCIANRTSQRLSHILMYDLADGSFWEIPVDPALVAKEPQISYTVIDAVDVVEGRLHFLLKSAEKTDLIGTARIRLRVVRQDGTVLYDNQWRHRHQSTISWRPAESRLLLSDTGHPDGRTRTTHVVRIDYATGQETAFPIAYPSEAEILRHSSGPR